MIWKSRQTVFWRCGTHRLSENSWDSEEQSAILQLQHHCFYLAIIAFVYRNIFKQHKKYHHQSLFLSGPDRCDALSVLNGEFSFPVIILFVLDVGSCMRFDSSTAELIGNKGTFCWWVFKQVQDMCWLRIMCFLFLC